MFLSTCLGNPVYMLDDIFKPLCFWSIARSSRSSSSRSIDSSGCSTQPAKSLVAPGSGGKSTAAPHLKGFLSRVSFKGSFKGVPSRIPLREEKLRLQAGDLDFCYWCFAGYCV